MTRQTEQEDTSRERRRDGITRRKFLASIGQTSASAAALASCTPASALADLPRPKARPKIAIVATVVRKWSHAQHFIDRFLEGYGWHGEHHYPPMDLVSMYVDQFPFDDLARERSRRHKVPIYPTIAEALTLGGSKLAVDAVLSIGEHGEYPKNAIGQKLYPRYRFFKEIIRVFESSGRAVPVFNDKHLSFDWDQCLEMVADSKRLGFPFMAGSSLPVTWRIPSLELGLDVPLQESVSIGCGPIDCNDFHALETVQCMSERRAGGEVGIKSVFVRRGKAVRELLEEQPTTRKLVFAALARSHTCAAERASYTYAAPDMVWLHNNSEAFLAYVIEHRDGFRTSMFLLNAPASQRPLEGLVSDYTYAGIMRDSGRVESCQMYLPMPPRVSLADFFSPLVNNIERMILEGAAPRPVERTLLTSGMTMAGVQSLYRGEAVQTPRMNIAYRAPHDSGYWKA